MTRQTRSQLLRCLVSGVAAVTLCGPSADADITLTPHPAIARMHGVITKQLGDFGESVVGAELRARGFEVINGNIGVTGIDRIAIKRGPTGELMDIRFIEVKTHQAIPDFELAITKNHGLQLSESWTRNNLERIVHNHPNLQTRRVASEILDHMRSQPAIIKRELHGIALKSNRYVVMTVDHSGRVTGIAANGRLSGLLKDLATRGSTTETRAAALQHLAKFDQIQSAIRTTGGEPTAISRASAEGFTGLAKRGQLPLGRMTPGPRGVVIVRNVNAAKNWVTMLASHPGVVAAGLTLAVDESFTNWEYYNGRISNADFRRQSAENGVKAAFVGLATQLVYVLAPTPSGLVLIGVGIVAYVGIEQAVKLYDAHAIPTAPSASELRGIIPEWTINRPMISDFVQNSNGQRR